MMRATVVWNPPAPLSQTATPHPGAKPLGSTSVICSSPKSPSMASGERELAAFRRMVLP
ncbi:MAG: hypothetical protein ABFE01_05170 [Phycisphaerales bacterium]